MARLNTSKDGQDVDEDQEFDGNDAGGDPDPVAFPEEGVDLLRRPWLVFADERKSSSNGLGRASRGARKAGAKSVDAVLIPSGAPPTACAAKNTDTRGSSTCIVDRLGERLPFWTLSRLCETKSDRVNYRRNYVMLSDRLGLRTSVHRTGERSIFIL